MSRLVACTACSIHFKVTDAACPHCGEALRLDAGIVGRTAGAMLLGLTLASCVGGDDSTTVAEPEYGVPATESASTTMDTDGGTDSNTSTTNDVTSAGEAEYGVADTGPWGTSSTTLDTDTDTDTDGSTSVGEPEYGVPTTDGSTSLEPDYGVPTTGG